MSSFHRAKTTERAKAAFGTLLALTMCLGCTGPGAIGFAKETRIQRLHQLLSFEARREQAAIARQCVLYREPRTERLIEQVLTALMADAPAHGGMPKVLLVREASLNAFSFPDGAIYIHTGLLARLEHESELALLLAHEIVHITRQHALQAAMLDCRKGAGGPFDGRELSDSLSWFHDTSPALGDPVPLNAVRDLRRTLEHEADRVGLDMLIKSNYDPHEALEIFEHLKTGAGTEETAERAARLSDQLASAALHAPARPRDTIAFSHRLHPLLTAQVELEIQRGEWESALRHVRRLLNDDPDNARGHYLLGELHRQRAEPGDEDLSLRHYDRAIGSDPLLPEPRKAAGLLLLKRGRAQAAQALFRSALDLAPQSSDNAYIRSYLTQCNAMIEGENP